MIDPLEQAAVERHGGKVVFTSGDTASSTHLINRYSSQLDPETREYLDGLRPDLPEILELIERATEITALVVGEGLIDEYRYVTPMAKSPKENLVATRYHHSETFLGGAFNVANMVASFTKEVRLVSHIGSDSPDLGRLKPNIVPRLIVRLGTPTTRKIRYVESQSKRKIFEVYEMEDAQPDVHLENAIIEMLGDMDFDLVLSADFGHGLMTSRIVDHLTESEFLAVNCQTNSGNFGFNLVTRYPVCDYVCIDLPEARLAMQDRNSPLTEIIVKLADGMDCGRVTVTQGKLGCVTYDHGEVLVHPALAKDPVDPVGAGDALLAVTSILTALGGSAKHVAFCGNVMGALKIKIMGPGHPDPKVALVKAVKGLLS